MSLPLPRLDDRTWQDLRDEGVSLIPRYALTWTNHNLSDPGITLVELLAYQTELASFRLDQVGEPFSRAFLRLLGNWYLPVGPRPAATLIQFDPANGQPRSRAESTVFAGNYFVPRQSPTNPSPGPRAGRISGIGDQVESYAFRSAGEPDEPLLHPSPPPDAAVVPEFGFRAAHGTFLTGIRLAAVQSFDGQAFRDITNVLLRAQPAPVWGIAPVDPSGKAAEQQPAVYLGFNLSFFDPSRLSSRDPTSKDQAADWALTLWCVPAGFGSADLSSPESDTFEPNSGVATPPAASASAPVRSEAFRPFDQNQQPLPHHSVKVCWEYLIDREWRAVPVSAPFRDESRGFTRPGRIVIPGIVFQTAKASADRAMRVIGAFPAQHFYVRARLAHGLPDAAPSVRGFFVDAVLVEQWDHAATLFYPRSTLTDNPRRAAPPEFLRDLKLTGEAEEDVKDAADDLARRGWGPDAAAWGKWPLWGSSGFDKKKPLDTPDWEVNYSEGYPQNRVSAVILGVSSGDPNQEYALPCPPTNTQFRPESPDEEDDGPTIRVMTDGLRVWTLEPPWGWLPTNQGPRPRKEWRAVTWGLVPDLLQGSRTIPEFQYEPTPPDASSRSRYTAPGRIVFGDGQNGRVPPPGSLILASYSWTVAEAANFSPGFVWARSTDREPNHPDQVIAFPTIRFRNPLPAEGGQDAEPLSQALRRMANEFEGPETLIELATSGPKTTLDGTDLTGVISPSMAVNLLDFECLARSVPGTEVARARAWASVDPHFPGVVAPGAVTVVIVPSLPADSPTPSEGLLRRVRAFLRERKPLACRLFVIGPEYQPVRVQATLHTARLRTDSVRQAADAAVRTFLHPIRGGSSGAGWPFGRDLHAGELMRTLAEIRDVVHVTGLQLAAGDSPWSDAAVCVPARALLQLTELTLDVKGDA
jgi:hypothetical protein